MILSTALQPNDFVGMSFFLATAIMLASTVFFFVERGDVNKKWRTSMTVAGLVTGIAFWHYLYMREAQVMGDVTTVFRYIDWLITVPLQIIEFYLILAAVTLVPVILFWKLLGASLLMLIAVLRVKPVYFQWFQHSSLVWLHGSTSFTRFSQVKPLRSVQIATIKVANLPSMHSESF